MRKLCKIYIILFSFALTISMSLGVQASRQSEACSNTIKCSSSLKSGDPYCVSYWSWVNHALECTIPLIVNNLSSQGSNKPLWQFEMRDLVEQYCKSLLWDIKSWSIYFARPSRTSDSWDWQQTFDSHQSLFVYVLCSSFGEDSFIQGGTLWGVLKDSDVVSVLKLKQKSWKKDLCSLDDYKTISDCDMSIYATEIFSAIMSDIFKIKYAQVVNVDKLEWFDPKKKVLDFMLWYFDYDYNGDFKKLQDQFPQTVDVIKSNQEYYRKVLDSVKLINNSAMADMASDTGCPKDENMTWDDFIACALHSSQGNGSALTPSFLTMIYNEILNYRVFELYINSWIEKKVETMSRAGENEKDMRRYMPKALDFQRYANMQIEATKQALRSFEDFNMTYPLHIWLLLYQEKVKYFRDKSLAPIVTLFYSLSEKLKNVQLPG